MSTFASPRGSRDILPDQNRLWQHVKQVCADVAHELSFHEITVPTFEDIGLFQRSLGEGTDIIDKELFLVRGRHSDEEHYALRPEGTAGIVRAFIQNGLKTYPQPVRLYSVLNLFRYERPQRGRYREHVQFDIEQFGTKEASADAWVILTQWRVLQRLGINDAALSLNSLGTNEERMQYQQALIHYFTPFFEQLSNDSKRRLSTNPLRILDSKDPLDQPHLPGAPHLSTFLMQESREHLAQVQAHLDTWQVPYALDPLLVRGLDYYSRTCFEWSVPAAEGRPLALGGGGRYDGLVPLLGGPDLGAVGGGLGLDRLVDLLEERGWTPPAPRAKLAVINVDLLPEQAAYCIIPLLEQHLALWSDFSRTSTASQLKAASKEQCTFALLVSSNGLELKELISGSQQRVTLEQVGDAVT